MQNLNEENITDAVIETFQGTQDARLKEILTSLVRHLHAFAREVNLTEDEWRTGVQYLTETGHITDERRQEFILWSDTLGVSTLKDAMNNRRGEGATEWSLLGPFYRMGAHDMPLGANIAQSAVGETLLVSGHVLTSDGTPIPDVLLDVWQSDAEGFYDVQRMDADHMDLRARFRTNDKGEFYFQTIKPRYYPIPNDGPVGKMLKATGRHPYRPAHIHFRLSAEGFKELTTELYLNGDRYLDSDAVFGVRSTLVVDLVQHETPDPAAARYGVQPPYYTLAYDFVMEVA